MAEAKSSSRVFLLSSVVLGVLATVISFAYLENSKSAAGVPKEKILVAKRDIRSNTPLDPDKDLKELEIPQGAFPKLRDSALAPNLIASYKGQRVNRDVLADTPILKTDLIAAAELNLTGDARALSLPIRGAQALGGLLVPGDYVTIKVTRPSIRPMATTVPSEDAGGMAPPMMMPSMTSYETRTVLAKPVKVLAIGTRLTRSRQQITVAEQFQMAAEPDTMQSVTLEVTDEQATTILQETGGGQLPMTLLLCPKPE